MNKNALIIGNSDGIGLKLTERLLRDGWHVTGISRSGSSIDSESYKHLIAEVQNDEYEAVLKLIKHDEEQIDLCVYCAGIGEPLDFNSMEHDLIVFNVNLIGLVKTVSAVIPAMIKKGSGHFIGLSSVADVLLSTEAPSYHASKAGFSNYLESLGLVLKPTGIKVTNVRFGFVDTKMAKGDVKPFMITIDKAVEHLFKCVKKKQIRYTAPKIVAPLVKLRNFMLGLKL